MLNTTKSINLTGQSKITVEGREITVVQLSANIYTDGSNSNIVSTVVNKELYSANKALCRADMDEFTRKVRELEDSSILTEEA